MTDGVRIAITAIGAWLLWLAIRRLGKFLAARIKSPRIREFLTKDRGGY